MTILREKCFLTDADSNSGASRSDRKIYPRRPACAPGTCRAKRFMHPRSPKLLEDIREAAAFIREVAKRQELG
ncbi:MAG: hypothetical protein AAB150_16190 [Pseudomonadota bacterium]